MEKWKTGIPTLKGRNSDGSNLISDWYTILIDQSEIKAYYHVWHGWMIKGDIDETWRFGYRPICKEVKYWK